MINGLVIVDAGEMLLRNPLLHPLLEESNGEMSQHTHTHTHTLGGRGREEQGGKRKRGEAENKSKIK